MARPLHAYIDPAAWRHNLAAVRRAAPRARVWSVVKANAYGHGVLRAYEALGDSTDGYALLELDAAVRLREAGFRGPIALLEGLFEASEVAEVLAHRLTVVVHHAEQLRMLDAVPAGSGVDVLVKVNTGMNRLGLTPADFAAAARRLGAHPGVGSLTVMTHFARADDDHGIAGQYEQFRNLADIARFPHCVANSAAILRYPESHCDWVRPGIMLYGVSPFANTVGEEVGLAPVMTLVSRLIAVRTVRAGETVGYGGVYTADRELRVGIVACGYADGYPRHAPTGTPIRVAGCMTRTVGRVSMDMLCVDLTPVPDAGVGTPVVLWGRGNPVERVAEAAGTVGYELLCAVAPRVPLITGTAARAEWAADYDQDKSR